MSRRRLPSKAARDLDKWLRGRGWTMSKVGNHPQYTHTNGSVLHVAGSPSDWRSRLNKQAEAKRLEEGGHR